MGGEEKDERGDIQFLYIKSLIFLQNTVSSLENQNKKNYRILNCLKYPFQIKNAITYVYLKRVVSILICVQIDHVQTDEIEQFTHIFNTMCFSVLK